MKSVYILFVFLLVCPLESFAQTPSVLVCEHLYLQVFHVVEAAKSGVSLETAIRTTQAFVEYTKDRGPDSLFVSSVLLDLIPVIYRDAENLSAETLARAIKRGCEQTLRFQ